MSNSWHSQDKMNRDITEDLSYKDSNLGIDSSNCNLNRENTPSIQIHDENNTIVQKETSLMTYNDNCEKATSKNCITAIRKNSVSGLDDDYDNHQNNFDNMFYMNDSKDNNMYENGFSEKLINCEKDSRQKSCNNYSSKYDTTPIKASNFAITPKVVIRRKNSSMPTELIKMDLNINQFNINNSEEHIMDASYEGVNKDFLTKPDEKTNRTPNLSFSCHHKQNSPSLDSNDSRLTYLWKGKYVEFSYALKEKNTENLDFTRKDMIDKNIVNDQSLQLSNFIKNALAQRPLENERNFLQTDTPCLKTKNIDFFDDKSTSTNQEENKFQRPTDIQSLETQEETKIFPETFKSFQAEDTENTFENRYPFSDLNIYNNANETTNQLPRQSYFPINDYIEESEVNKADQVQSNNKIKAPLYVEGSLKSYSKLSPEKYQLSTVNENDEMNTVVSSEHSCNFYLF